MTFCEGQKNGPKTNHSDFSGDPFQDPDPEFLSPDPDHIHAASVLSRGERCSPGGSTILGGDLCYPGADCLAD